MEGQVEYIMLEECFDSNPVINVTSEPTFQFCDMLLFETVEYEEKSDGRVIDCISPDNSFDVPFLKPVRLYTKDKSVRVIVVNISYVDMCSYVHMDVAT